MLGSDRNELPEVRYASGRRTVQFGEHLIEAATRRTQDKDARLLVADIAEGVAPAACPEEEASCPDAEWCRLAFDLDEELAA